MSLKFYIAIVITAALNVAAQSAAKTGLQNFPQNISLQTILKLLTNPYIASSILIQILGMSTWYYVLANNKISSVFPALLATIFIFTIILDATLWQQNISVQLIIGLSSIIFGILLITKYG